MDTPSIMAINQTKPVYTVRDTHTGKTVATFTTWRKAVDSADRKNNAYGAYRYANRTVWPTEHHDIMDCSCQPAGYCLKHGGTI